MRTIPWGLRWILPSGHEPGEGGAEIGRRRRANHPTGAFGGAPYGATSHVRGAAKWGGEGMRAIPLGP